MFGNRSMFSMQSRANHNARKLIKNPRVSVRAKEEEAALESIQFIANECSKDEVKRIRESSLCQHIKAFIRDVFLFPGESQDRVTDYLLDYFKGE